MLSRRTAFKATAGLAATATIGVTQGAEAADTTIKIGMNLSFTGADAESAARIANGALLAFEGPNMANYMAKTVGIKSVFVLDDSGAYGVGIADSFQRRSEEIGVKILGRDRLDPKAADYSAILTKIKSLNPDCLYYGGVSQ